MKIKELDPPLMGGSACLVQIREQHYRVSTTRIKHHDETLAFKCDANGEVTDWSEVCGGREATREEVIEMLTKLP